VCDSLPWIHFEVKAVERLNVEEAMNQARADAGRDQGSAGASPHQKTPIVAHRRNFGQWLVTMEADTFFRLLRGDFPQQPQLDSLAPARSALDGPSSSMNSFRRFPSGSSLGGKRAQSILAEDACPRSSEENKPNEGNQINI
jgi:hypothetical protein